MKKVRIALLTGAILCFAICMLCFTIFAESEEKSVTVSYVNGDGITTEAVAIPSGSGSASVVLPDLTSSLNAFAGWFTEDGTFYEKGESATVSSDTTFYVANGNAVSTKTGFLLSLSSGATYIKLNSDILIDSSLEIKDSVIYLDLGGNTLTIAVDDNAFYGKNFGFVFANGTINYNYTGSDAKYLSSSFIYTSPLTSASNLIFTVKGDAKLNTQMGFLTIANDISAYSGALRLSVYGSLSANRLIRSNGVSSGVVSFYDGSSYTTDCEYFFDDFSLSNDLSIKLFIYGGSFNLNQTTGITKTPIKHKTIIPEGSSALFSKNISSFFEGGYTFTKDGEMYKFNGCKHLGPLVNYVKIPDPTIPADELCECTIPVKAYYQCTYCEAVYEELLANGFGHSYNVTMAQSIINEKEKTEPGIYKYTCTVCGDSYEKLFYPDPSKVYVTVGYIKDGEYLEERVPSSDLFTFEATKIMSFSSAYFESVVNVTQENIVFLEIPLGTTSVQGSFKNDTKQGAFRRNTFLKEISLPSSMTDVEMYAFSDMERLENIIGLEYITGSIGTEAFAQASNSPLIINNMVLNAKTIGQYAFMNVRMVTLTVGENVSKIDIGAFKLESHETMIKEVFSPKYVSTDATTVTLLFKNEHKMSYNSDEQQFGDLLVAYPYNSHNYVKDDSKTVAPTCTHYGYDVYVCSQGCGRYEERNIQPQLTHDYENKVVVESSCRVKGYRADVCKHCGDEQNKLLLPYNYSIHIYTDAEIPYFEPTVLPALRNICESNYYTLGKCKCGDIEEDIEANRTYHSRESSNGSHKFSDEAKIILAPTCGTSGRQEVTCTVCGTTRSFITPPSGLHHYGEVIPIIPATCRFDGTGYRICSVCYEENSGVVPGHDLYAQYVKDGKIREATIPAGPAYHNYKGTGEIIVQATETTKGREKAVCSLCGGISEIEIPRTPRPAQDTSFPVWAIILIVIVSLLLTAGIVMTVVFTVTKKKSAGAGYKYKFNTLNMK